jgi:hypothetical protein
MEGSRFGLCQTTFRFCSQNLTRPNHEAAGGSRERPRASQFYWLYPSPYPANFEGFDHLTSFRLRDDE